MIPDDLKDLAREYITDKKPLGPANASRLDDPKVAELLFERENRLYDYVADGATIIVGRRGSGKTSFLQSARFKHRNDIIIEIQQEDILGRVLEALEPLARKAV